MPHPLSETHTCSGWHEGRMHGDVITLGPELLQRHLLHPPALRHLWRSNGVITNGLRGKKKKGDASVHGPWTRDSDLSNRNRTWMSSSYPHPKRLHSCGHLFPDSPKTNYSKGFAVQLFTHELQKINKTFNKKSSERLRQNVPSGQI